MARATLNELKPFLTHPTPVALGLAALALAARYRVRLMTAWGFVAFAVGVASFVPQEYAFHRFLLHAPPVDHPRLKPIQDRLHYAHHKDPSDPRFIFGPLWGVAPLAVAVWLLFVGVTRRRDIGGLLSAGTFAAYAHYEFAHFVAHSPIVPRTRWGRGLKAMHLWHHHKNEHLWFGVTSKEMDHLAGTYEEVREVERSGTTRDLAASAEA